MNSNLVYQSTSDYITWSFIGLIQITKDNLNQLKKFISQSVVFLRHVLILSAVYTWVSRVVFTLQVIFVQIFINISAVNVKCTACPIHCVCWRTQIMEFFNLYFSPSYCYIFVITNISVITHFCNDLNLFYVLMVRDKVSRVTLQSILHIRNCDLLLESRSTM